MSPAQEIDALRRLAIKQPRISVTRAMRLIREREKQDAMTALLSAGNAARRDAERRQEWAGALEGLL